MTDSIDVVLKKIDRRVFLKGMLAVAAMPSVFLSEAAAALSINSDFSPKNAKRKRRLLTDIIILHTTEGSYTSSLNKLKRYGEAHYLVNIDGAVTRIIGKDRVARHAGRSMWNGRTNLDNYSVGIEVVGYHNKPINSKQIAAVKQLVAELQNVYGISDDNVLPHSMVAYGTPNRWHRYNHRGRKRCGMYFADPNFRKKLGLTAQPAYDPDVKAGRLRVADAGLNNVLYGKRTSAEPIMLASVGNKITQGVSAWTIARAEHNSPSTVYTFPDGQSISGDRIKDWGNIPIGTKVAMDVGESRPDDIEYFQKITGIDTAWKIVGKEYNRSTTIYFLPDGRVRTGTQLGKYFLDHLPRNTELLTGYIYGGRVTQDRSVSRIAGNKWDDSSTFYRLPSGKIISGDDINPNQIKQGTILFYQK
ncbi:MAG: peptidoglycan recognition family protein [Nanoarchaeota archaeon]